MFHPSSPPGLQTCCWCLWGRKAGSWVLAHAASPPAAPRPALAPAGPLGFGSAVPSAQPRLQGPDTACLQPGVLTHWREGDCSRKEREQSGGEESLSPLPPWDSPLHGLGMGWDGTGGGAGRRRRPFSIWATVNPLRSSVRPAQRTEELRGLGRPGAASVGQGGQHPTSGAGPRGKWARPPHTAIRAQGAAGERGRGSGWPSHRGWGPRG